MPEFLPILRTKGRLLALLMALGALGLPGVNYFGRRVVLIVAATGTRADCRPAGQSASARRLPSVYFPALDAFCYRPVAAACLLELAAESSCAALSGECSGVFHLGHGGFGPTELVAVVSGIGPQLQHR